MNIELLSFLAVSCLVAITPGPSVIYVVSYSFRYSSKAGIVSTLGINLGSVVAILVSAFGLAYLLEQHPHTMLFIQTIGAIYIIYLATLMWPRKSNLDYDGSVLTEKNYWNLFKSGFVTSLLNPKDILFYTAFIPTFIPDSAMEYSYKMYFLMLAFSYMVIGFVTKSAFAIFSGYAKGLLNSKNARYVNYQRCPRVVQ